jgi:hypothetical protein
VARLPLPGGPHPLVLHKMVFTSVDLIKTSPVTQASAGWGLWFAY